MLPRCCRFTVAQSARFRGGFAALAVFLSALGPSAAAAADTTDVYATRHNHLLSLPRLLWTGLVYPLGALTIYAEHEEVPRRTMEFFTNEAGTFGIFPQVQLGGETGTGGGIRTFHSDLFGRGKLFEAAYVYAGEGLQTGGALYRDPNIAGGAFYWDAAASWLQTDNRNATVNGHLRLDKRPGGERFAIERADVESVLGWRRHSGDLEEYRDNIYLESRLGWHRRELSRATEPPSGLALVPAGLGETLKFYSVGLRLAYDDRDYKKPVRELSHPLNYVLPGRILQQSGDLYYSFRDITYPERGGLAEIQADFATGSDDVRFWNLKAQVQRFFPLFYSNRILALRALVEKAHRIEGDITDGDVIPYSDLHTLGGSQRLRGFKRGSLRGEGILLLVAEYRYPIWDTWNAYLFWEEGQVFNKFDQVETGRFRTSYGGGISLRTERAFLIGLRVSHSAAEDALVGFSLEQEF
ncbi:MAG: BamA/TamA family outer membrane protein [Candidatus Latescibacteria bacterium]|nr:BamA/TamA family outer membrane protein [Candidatus Latescibacterota bacterium]